MGSSLAETLAEIGFVDKNLLEQVQNEKKQMEMKAAEKIAKLAKKAELAVESAKKSEEEKARLLAENTDLKTIQTDIVIDMLRFGTPAATIAKWMLMSEDEIIKIQSEMDLPSN